MQSTRILRSVAEKQGGFLLPPRTSMDILASAANAVMNLFSSQEDRIRFATFVEKKFIDTSVLGQANLSYLRILALHDELNSPTLKEHGFDVNEFLEGVKPALEQLHEVQASLQNKLCEIAASSTEDDEEDEKEDDDDSFDDKNLLSSIMFPNSDANQVVRRLMKKKYSFKEVAQQDADSNEARLIAMLSPQHLERFETASKLSFAFTSPQFQELSVKVHNIALLSARGMVIDADEEAASDEISSDEAKQKVVDTGEDVGTTTIPAVAAQIEVLYDVEETLEVPVEKDDVDLENKNESGDEQETKTVTRTSVVVGIFEGWLSGGNNPEEGLRWRVADVRYPFEFPFITARGLNE